MRPFDENDLIAFHLHELSPRRQRALERALITDASLAREAAEVAAMLQAFHGHTALDLDKNLIERNWLALEPTIMKVPPAPAPRFHWGWNKPIVFAGGVALAAFSFMAGVFYHADRFTPPLTYPTHSGEVMNPGIPPAIHQNQSVQTPATATPIGRGEKDLIRHSIRPYRPQFFASAQSAQEQLSPRTADSPASAPAPASIPHPTPSIPATLPIAPAPTSSSQTTTSVATAGVPDGQAMKTVRHASPLHQEHVSDITLALGGTFTATHSVTTNGVTRSEGATNAVSALASFHQQFRPLAGYRITASYTRPDFLYGQGNSGQQDINGRVFELAGTYVIQGPRRGRISTSVEAGSGVMVFMATVDSPNTSSNVHAAGIVGAAAELALTNRLSLRTAYRGQVFKGPDFRALPWVYPLVTSTTLFSSEPSIGITYRFAHKQQ